jgi:hypothetical protein
MVTGLTLEIAHVSSQGHTVSIQVFGKDTMTYAYCSVVVSI